MTEAEKALIDYCLEHGASFEFHRTEIPELSRAIAMERLNPEAVQQYAQAVRAEKEAGTRRNEASKRIPKLLLDGTKGLTAMFWGEDD